MNQQSKGHVLPAIPIRREDGCQKKAREGPPKGQEGVMKGGRNGRDGHVQIQGARLVRVWYAFCSRWMGLKPKRPADLGQLGLEKRLRGDKKRAELGGD